MIDVLKIVNWFKVRNYSDMKTNDNVEALTQLKVMKLLYYAQGVSLAVYDKVLFPEKILAWRYGPAVQEVYDVYKGSREIVDSTSNGMSDTEIGDYQEVNSDQEAALILNAVVDAYGDMSAIELMNQTHGEAPWLEITQSQEIDVNLIKDFFVKEIVE